MGKARQGKGKGKGNAREREMPHKNLLTDNKPSFLLFKSSMLDDLSETHSS